MSVAGDGPTTAGAMGMGCDLESRIDAARALFEAFLAEYHGLCLAKTVHPHVRPSYSPDARLQQAFERGLREGQELKALARGRGHS